MVISVKRSRRERKHAALRVSIISTAIELFSRRGLDHVSSLNRSLTPGIWKRHDLQLFPYQRRYRRRLMANIESLLQAKIPDFAASRKILESVLIDFLRFHFRLKKPHHRFVQCYFLAQTNPRTEQFLPYMLEMQKLIYPPLRICSCVYRNPRTDPKRFRHPRFDRRFPKPFRWVYDALGY